VTSSLLSRASAAFLGLGGLALLFAPDAVLPWLAPGFPASAGWVGQALGGAWLGVASLDWHARFAVLGGLHGRPTVSANVTLFVVSALAVARAAQRAGFPAGPTVLGAVLLALAVAWGRLLWVGPFAQDAGREGE